MPFRFVCSRPAHVINSCNVYIQNIDTGFQGELETTRLVSSVFFKSIKPFKKFVIKKIKLWSNDKWYSCAGLQIFVMLKMFLPQINRFQFNFLLIFLFLCYFFVSFSFFYVSFFCRFKAFLNILGILNNQVNKYQICPTKANLDQHVISNLS